MDLDNLKRAANIQRKVEILNKVADKLANGSGPRVRIYGTCGDDTWVDLDDKALLSDILHVIDNHIDSLLEEAKTL